MRRPWRSTWAPTPAPSIWTAPISRRDALAAAEAAANAVIDAALPVTATFVTQEELAQLPLRKPPKVTEAIRVVQVAGFDWSACGGTHVANSAQVGLDQDRRRRAPRRRAARHVPVRRTGARRLCPLAGARQRAGHALHARAGRSSRRRRASLRREQSHTQGSGRSRSAVGRGDGRGLVERGCSRTASSA